MRTLVHATVLALADLIGIWVGFLVFAWTPGSNQLAAQIPVAAAVSVIGFCAWSRSRSLGRHDRLLLRGPRDRVAIYGLAFVVASALFVPIHFLLTGYWTAPSNPIALWIFQALVNPFAVGTAPVARDAVPRSLSTQPPL